MQERGGQSSRENEVSEGTFRGMCFTYLGPRKINLARARGCIERSRVRLIIR